MEKNMLARAIALSSKLLEGKVDRAGKPYILHCLRVMFSVDEKDEELMQVAILHDVVEDTPMTVEGLKQEGFSARVLHAVNLLTHYEHETYDEYIHKISINSDATTVKLADLRDNSNITRLKGLRKKDFDRMEKYHKAYIYLSN